MNELRERIVALVAASAFNPNQHPRGAGGKYIVVGGTVQTLGPTNQPISEGTVTGINPQNGLISVKNSQTGQISQVPPAKLTTAPTRQATIFTNAISPNTNNGLNGEAATGQMSSNPKDAKYQGLNDANAGRKPMTNGSPAALYAYTQAYNQQKARNAAIALRNTAAAARRAVAAKRAAAAAAKKAKAAKTKKTKAAGKAGTGYKYVAYHSSAPAAKGTKPGRGLGA